MAGKKDKKKEKEFCSFDEVLEELKINEDELNRMVSEGEIRAFRDGEAINFKKEDIDNLKKGKITEPTVPLSAEELLGPDEAVKPEVPTEETVGVTEEVPFADEDITIADVGEEKPAEVELEDQKTFVEGDTGEMTVPLGGEEEVEATFVEEAPPEIAEPVAKEAAEAVVEKPAVAPPPLLPEPPPIPAVKPRPTRARPMAIPVPEIKIKPIFIVLMGVTFLVLLFVGSLLADTFRISTGKANAPIGITRELGKLIVGFFGIKDKEGDKIDFDKYKP